MPRRRSNFAFLPAFLPLAAASSAAAVLELASEAEDLYPTMRFSTGAAAGEEGAAAAGRVAAGSFPAVTATEAVAEAGEEGDGHGHHGYEPTS